MPTYPNWLAGNRITAGQLNAGLPITIIKPADEPLTSNITLQNDNDLVISVAASTSWILDCWLDYEGGTINTSDLKWQWSVPSLATMRYDARYQQPGGTVISQLSNTGSAIIAAATNGAGNLRSARMTGTIIVGANAGPVQLTWAQNTTNATATIVHAQSYLKLLRTA